MELEASKMKLVNSGIKAASLVHLAATSVVNWQQHLLDNSNTYEFSSSISSELTAVSIMSWQKIQW